MSCVFYRKEVHNVIIFCHDVCNPIDLCHNARNVAKLHDNTTQTCKVNKHKQCIWKLQDGTLLWNFATNNLNNINFLLQIKKELQGW